LMYRLSKESLGFVALPFAQSELRRGIEQLAAFRCARQGVADELLGRSVVTCDAVEPGETRRIERRGRIQLARFLQRLDGRRKIPSRLEHEPFAEETLTVRGIGVSGLPKGCRRLVPVIEPKLVKAGEIPCRRSAEIFRDELEELRRLLV